MKRIISLVVVVLMMICLSACGNETVQETSDGGNVDGGWTAAESNALTEEQLEIFNKAMDGIRGKPGSIRHQSSFPGQGFAYGP